MSITMSFADIALLALMIVLIPAILYIAGIAIIVLCGFICGLFERVMRVFGL